MKDFLSILEKLPFSVKILLLSSMLRSISFFALVPFWPVFLYKDWDINQQNLGIVLGAVMLIATAISLYGGFLADRFNKLRVMLVLDVIMVALYLILNLADSLPTILLLFVLSTTASSSLGVTGNALLADILEPELRAKVVSLRYALQNIGTAIGPALGAWVAFNYARGPLLVAAGAIAVSFVLLLFARDRFHAVDAANPEEKSELNFVETLTILRKDKKLVLFLAGGILSMVVYGPLLTYLPMYLSTLELSVSDTYQKIAAVAAVNAAVVISLQYSLGGRVTNKNLLTWLSWGTGALIVGLLGLASSNLLIVWMIAVTIFTLGEIILVPAEYMVIEQLAPKNLRGSYFGAQNLVHLGLAIGPILCGAMLANMVPTAMFYALIGVAALSMVFYYFACRKPNEKGIVLASAHPKDCE